MLSTHVNKCLLLNKYLHDNDTQQLENMITSLYVNLEENKKLLQSASEEDYKRWYNTLRNIVATSQLAPMYRTICYVILLQYIKQQKKCSLTKTAQKRIEAEYQIQMQILQDLDTDAAHAINAYLQSPDVKRWTAPVISKKISTLNYATVLLMPYIGRSERLIQQKLLSELNNDLKSLNETNILPLIQAWFELSKDSSVTSLFIEKIMKYEQKLLAMNVRDDYKNALAFIIGKIWLLSTEDVRLSGLRHHSEQPTNIINSISHLLSNLTSSASVSAILEVIPYDIFYSVQHDNDISIKKLSSALARAFQLLSKDEIIHCFKFQLYKFLVNIEYKPSFYTNIFANALAKQNPEVIQALLDLILNTKKELKGTHYHPYSLVRLAEFVSILILALPKDQQIIQLCDNVNPLFEVTECQSFVIKIFAELAENNIHMDNEDNKFQITLKDPSAALVEVLEKNKSLTNRLFAMMKTAIRENNDNKKDMQNIAHIVLHALKSDEKIIELITETSTTLSNTASDTNQNNDRLAFILLLSTMIKGRVSSELCDQFYIMTGSEDSALSGLLLANLMRKENSANRSKRLKAMRSFLNDFADNINGTMQLSKPNAQQTLANLLNRDYYALNAYYKLSPKSTGFDEYMEFNLSTLKPGSPRMHILARMTISMLLLHTPTEYKLRVLTNSEYFNASVKHKEIIAIIKALDDSEYTNKSINTIWGILRRNDEIYEHIMLQDVYNNLSQDTSRLYLINLVYEHASANADYASKFFFDFITYALSCSSATVEDKIFPMIYSFTSNVHNESIQQNAVVMLNRFRNKLLAKYFDKLSDPEKLAIPQMAALLVSRMLAHLDMKQLQLLCPQLANSSSDLIFDMNTLIDILQSKKLEKNKAAEAYISLHLALANDKNDVIEIQKELNEYIKQLSGSSDNNIKANVHMMFGNKSEKNADYNPVLKRLSELVDEKLQMFAQQEIPSSQEKIYQQMNG